MKREIYNYTRVYLKRSLSTIEEFTVILKTIGKKAIAQGTIHKNPFSGYFPGKTIKKHHYLEAGKREHLMSTPVQKKFLRYARNLFVFSTFRAYHIQTCVIHGKNIFYRPGNDKLWVRFSRQKTKSECIIQILDLPQRIKNNV